jgi:hypothetical protein
LRSGVLVTVSGGKVTLRSLAGRRMRTFAPGRGRVLADLEPEGLYYSYGTRGGGGGRLVFVPRAKLFGGASAR